MAKNYCCNTESMAKEDIWKSLISSQVFQAFNLFFSSKIVFNLVSTANIHSKSSKSLQCIEAVEKFKYTWNVSCCGQTCRCMQFWLLCCSPSHVFSNIFWVALSLPSHLWPLFRHIFYGFVTAAVFVPGRQDFVNMSRAHLFSINMHRSVGKKSHNKMQRRSILKVLLQLEAFKFKTFSWPL